MTGSGLGTEHGGTPLGNVQVDFEDAVLREEELEAFGDDQLLDLAQHRTVGAEIEILGDLLRDRAAAAHAAAVAEVVGNGVEQLAPVARIQQREAGIRPVPQLLGQRFPVNAAMLFETAIFRDDHGAPQLMGYAVQRNPAVL